MVRSSAFSYLCFAKTGCGSAKPRLEQAPPLVFALAFHYFCIDNYKMNRKHESRR